MSLLEELKSAQKSALKNKEKVKLGAIRMAVSAIRQREIDEKITLSDSETIAVLTKLIKQRNDSALQYEQAKRDDLATKEREEIIALEAFLPTPLSDEEVVSLIASAIEEIKPEGIREMGKVMAWLKPKVQGRTDMGKVSQQIKARLS